MLKKNRSVVRKEDGRRGEGKREKNTFGGVGCFVLAEPLEVLVFYPGHIWCESQSWGRSKVSMEKDFSWARRNSEMGRTGKALTVVVVFIILLLGPIHDRYGIDYKMGNMQVSTI